MRLFLGIPLAESVAAEMAKLVERLRPAAADLRWSAPESWHITLQFLGNASEEQYRCLIARVAEVRSPPVPIQVAEPGIFERAGIFHVGVELTPALAALQAQIVAATAGCGFEAESRPYHPHITLARSKGANRARELRALQSHLPRQIRFPRFTAPEFLLYESHTLQTGSQYEVLHRFPLRGGADEA